MILSIDLETRIIKDEDGKIVSLKDAQWAMETNRVEDSTLAFFRFARGGYDWDALDAFYREARAEETA